MTQGQVNELERIRDQFFDLIDHENAKEFVEDMFECYLKEYAANETQLETKYRAIRLINKVIELLNNKTF